MSEMVTIERRAAVEHLLQNRDNMLVVCGLGSSTYDVYAAGDHHANFYLWGAMGGAGMIGLGLAIAEPDRQVMVITGDGEALMGIGALATVAAQKPNNLSIVVLDNEHFGETGMQEKPYLTWCRPCRRLPLAVGLLVVRQSMIMMFLMLLPINRMTQLVRVWPW